mgnify:CR=1 FL=1
MPHTKESPPAAQRAYDAVKEGIIYGRIPSESMLSEVDVAKTLGMSRTPVHEAFLLLETEGFLKLYPRRGALVTAVSPDAIREVYQARELIDLHAARSICAQSDAARHALGVELNQIIERQEQALTHGDLRAYTTEDAHFHQTIMEAGGNALIAQFSLTLRSQQERFTATAVGRNLDIASEFVSGHKTLTSALIDGNYPAYADALAQHLTVSRTQL